VGQDQARDWLTQLANEGKAGWTAHLECAGDPAAIDDHFDDQLVELMHRLKDCGGSVSGRIDGRYGATFSVYTDSNSASEVVDLALAVFLGAVNEADMPPWPIVRCEVLTFAEHDRELDE